MCVTAAVHPLQGEGAGHTLGRLVGAMNQIASLFAGNVEALAGFILGLVSGVYEATGALSCLGAKRRCG